MTRMSLDGFVQVQRQLASNKSSRHTPVTEIGPDKSAFIRASMNQVRAAIIRGNTPRKSPPTSSPAAELPARFCGRSIHRAVARQRPCSARRSRRSRATFAERVLGESDTVRSLLELVGPTMPPRRTCAAIPHSIPAVWIRRAV